MTLITALRALQAEDRLTPGSAQSMMMDVSSSSTNASDLTYRFKKKENMVATLLPDSNWSHAPLQGCGTAPTK